MADNLSPQAVTLEGVMYTIMPLAGMASFRMQNRLAAILAPSAAPLLIGDTAALPAAIRDLFVKLTPNEQEEITRELLDRSTADGKTLLNSKGTGCFDAHFATRSHLVWPLLHHAIRVNFSGGFDALVKWLRPLLAGMLSKAAESNSPSTSDT